MERESYSGAGAASDWQGPGRVAVSAAAGGQGENLVPEAQDGRRRHGDFQTAGRKFKFPYNHPHR